jgi:hypothetical protein
MWEFEAHYFKGGALFRVYEGGEEYLLRLGAQLVYDW